jgi:sugar fermentation stimulation protein A
MEFTKPLIPATLIKRYKRFLADIRFADGTEVTATCPNTGAMLGLCEPGSTIYVSHNGSPKRKYAWTWHITERADVGCVGIDTSLPNRLAEEAIAAKMIPKLADYENLRREVKYGENSRIDLLLTGEGQKDCYVEVKNVTLIRQPQLAQFPDCKTERGTKHLREMSAMVENGHRAMMLYMIQCAAPTGFSLDPTLDPIYVKTFEQARRTGVEAIALTCHVSPDRITVKQLIPILPA